MLNDKRILPDPRLELLQIMTGKCRTCADVGSDHGRLGACLLQSGQCERVVMTDISDASLMKARRLIKLLGLEDKTEFAVGDGLNALKEEADVVVIAGMGGETIASIMAGAKGRFKNTRFLLQPNVAIPFLRTQLNEMDFAICDERLVREGRRIYVILEAIADKQSLTEAEVEVGPVLLSRKDPLLADYADFRIRVLNKALEGARRGNDPGSVHELERQLRIWEETRACL